MCLHTVTSLLGMTADSVTQQQGQEDPHNRSSRHLKVRFADDLNKPVIHIPPQPGREVQTSSRSYFKMDGS